MNPVCESYDFTDEIERLRFLSIFLPLFYRAFQTHLCQRTRQAGWLPAAERGQATYTPLPGTKMFETLCIYRIVVMFLCLVQFTNSVFVALNSEGPVTVAECLRHELSWLALMPGS
jgi:hypothetical protein